MTDTGSPGGPADSHLKQKNQNRVRGDIEYRPRNQGNQGKTGMPLPPHNRPEVDITPSDDRGGNHNEQVPPGKGKNRFSTADKGQQDRGRQVSGGNTRYRHKNKPNQTGIPILSCPLRPAGAKIPGNVRGGTGPAEDGNDPEYIVHRKCHGNSTHLRRPQQGHEKCIRKAVDYGQRHREHRRKNEPGDGPVPAERALYAGIHLLTIPV